MLTTNLTGNLGNHMWQYAVCRTVAEKLGYEWGINPIPSHDYFNGGNQMDFMNIDFGTSIEGITNEYHEPWMTFSHIDVVNITMLNPSLYEIADNTIMLGDNGAKGGIYQSEDYIIDRKEDIRKWFTITPHYRNQYEDKLKELDVTLDDNTCIINFRGGEYRSIPNVLLRREYWADSINHIKGYKP